eukprot:1157751-Pelagomonas_calceolata.AAC.8
MHKSLLHALGTPQVISLMEINAIVPDRLLLNPWHLQKGWPYRDVSDQITYCLSTNDKPRLRPKLQQRVCGKPADNIASDFGFLQGPLVLVGYSSPGEAHKKAGRFNQAPIGHLRARYLSWPTPGVVSSSFDDVNCNAGRRE